jgi:hypothetical protein
MYFYLLSLLIGVVLGWRAFSKLLTILVCSVPLAAYQTYTSFIENYTALLQQTSWWSWIPFFGQTATMISTSFLIGLAIIQFLLLMVLYGVIGFIGYLIGSRFSEED